MKGRNSWEHLYLNIAVSFLLHLVDEWSHSIDTCITTRNDTNGLVLLRQQECLFGTLAFMLHTCVDTFCIRAKMGRNELEVVLIAHYHITFTDGLYHCGSDVFLAARSYACYDDTS